MNYISLIFLIWVPSSLAFLNFFEKLEYGAKYKNQICDRRPMEEFYPELNNDKTIRLGLMISKISVTSGSITKILGLKIPGALTYAVEKVNKEKILPDGYKLQFIAKNPDHYMPDHTYLEDALELINDRKIHALIGPDLYCSQVNDVGYKWNLPMFSYNCGDKFPGTRNNLISLVPTNYKRAQALASVIKQKKWKRIVILYSEVRSQEAGFLEGILRQFENEIHHHDIEVQLFPVYFPSLSAFRDIIQKTKKNASVFVMCIHFSYINLMFRAMKKERILGQYSRIPLLYADTEEITWNSVDLYTHPLFYSNPLHYRKSETIYRIHLDKIMYVVGIPISHSRSASHFHKRVVDMNKKEPFCLGSKFQMSSGDPVETHVPLDASSALFDSVMLYAKAVHDIYLSRSRVSGSHVSVEEIARDGEAIANHVSNTTFIGVLGEQIYLDEFASRQTRFKLYTLRSHKICRKKSKSRSSLCLIPSGIVDV